MKNIMKRLLTLLVIMMLMRTISFSSTISNGIENDSIVSITQTQLKETNLIFAEHYKLLIENDLLKYQLNNYKEDNNLLIKTDSLRVSQINYLKYQSNSLNDVLKKKNKILSLWKIGGITISSSLLILLLIK